MLLLIILLSGIIIFLVFGNLLGNNQDNPDDLQNIPGIDQLDDAISHNLSLANNPPSCSDECSAKGLKKCFGNGYKICGNFDSNSCYEWSSIRDCNSGEECKIGRCAIIEDNEEEPETINYEIEFDDIEVLEAEQFSIKKISESGTWENNLLGTSDKLNITHSKYNLKQGNTIVVGQEKFLKVSGENGADILRNYMDDEAYGNGNKMTRSFFFSGAKLIGEKYVVDKLSPQYSTILYKKFDSKGNLEEIKLAFSNILFDKYSGNEVYNWERFVESSKCIDECPELGLKDCDGNNLKKCGNYDSDPCLEWSLLIKCENGCENNACVGEEIYHCPGTVFAGLCYAISPYTFQEINNTEDSGLKIWVEYPSKVTEGEVFNITFNIQNKLSEVKNLLLSESLQEENVESLTNLPDSLTLNAQEIKQFKLTFEAKKTNLYPSKLELISFLVDGKKYVLSLVIFINAAKDYVECAGLNFPNKYIDSSGDHSYAYDISKCCDNAFYPGFECCSDSDCSYGACIDGICIYNMFQGFSAVKDPAKGNKKVLVILSSNTNPTDPIPCSNKKDSYLETITGIENFYDSMAQKYLNEDSDFINFDWEILGNFNIVDLGLNGAVDVREMLNNASDYCNKNLQDYHEIIVYNVEQDSWCGHYTGCAGRPISTKEISAGHWAHELAHNFGCRDLYLSGGSFYQWRNSLMSSFEDMNLISNIASLDVCRGEMGWADLNGNGIAEIYEFDNYTEYIKD